MVRYDDDVYCKKCGMELKYDNVNYTYIHDMEYYKDSYKEVDKNFCKQVGFGFYCNNCYDKIKDESIKSIIEDSHRYIENDLQQAIDKLQVYYNNKLNQLNSIKDYIEHGVQMIKDKDKLSELTKQELEYLVVTSEIYNVCYQNIKVGFCPIKLKPELLALLNESI